MIEALYAALYCFIGAAIFGLVDGIVYDFIHDVEEDFCGLLLGWVAVVCRVVFGELLVVVV